MAFERENDGNQWYNTNPNKLNSREAIDRYMKGYNDTLMLLDSLEGEAVLSQGNQDLNNAWFKKVDKQLRGNSKNQYDQVRSLSDSEKAINLTSIDDLVDNNFMTNRGPGNGVYKPDDFSSAYVNVPYDVCYLMVVIPVRDFQELCPSSITPSDSGVTMAMKKAY